MLKQLFLDTKIYKILKKVTAEERTELLSRNAVDVHNSSVDNSVESGIIESKKKSNFVPAKTKQEAKEVLDNGIM